LIFKNIENDIKKKKMKKKTYKTNKQQINTKGVFSMQHLKFLCFFFDVIISEFGHASCVYASVEI